MNNSVKLLLFDFDQTLCKEHFYHKYGENEEVYNEDVKTVGLDVFNKQNFNNYDHMKILFRILIQKYNIKIGVISFGYQHMLEKFIGNSFGYDLISKNDIIGTDGISDRAININTCAIHPSFNLNVCKNHLIEELCKRYDVLNRKNVLFFDDDNSNVIQARNGGYNAINNIAGELNIDKVLSGIKKFFQISIQQNEITSANQLGGYDIYYHKYLKYKHKYVTNKKLKI